MSAHMHTNRYLNKELKQTKKALDQSAWVDRIFHLGNTLTNDSNITDDEMTLKKARYIAQNIEINQEFYFSTASLLDGSLLYGLFLTGHFLMDHF